MGESNEGKSTIVSETIKAAGELVEKVPIYDDAVKPLAREVGKTLGTVGKTINAALSPIRGLVWGIEQIESYIHQSLSEKLKAIPEKNIITPNPVIAGPTLEALRFTGNDVNLREMYANLLANAMDKDTVEKAHPSFVEIIKQLTSFEAKLLVYLSEIKDFPDVCSVSRSDTGADPFDDYRASLSHNSQEIKLRFCKLCEEYESLMNLQSAYDNYRRLSILDIDIATRQEYRPLEEWELSYEEQEAYKSSISIEEDDQKNKRMTFDFSVTYKLYFTSLGADFIDVCVRDKT